jgi:hypothetical protein
MAPVWNEHRTISSFQMCGPALEGPGGRFTRRESTVRVSTLPVLWPKGWLQSQAAQIYRPTDIGILTMVSVRIFNFKELGIPFCSAPSHGRIEFFIAKSLELFHRVFKLVSHDDSLEEDSYHGFLQSTQDEKATHTEWRYATRHVSQSWILCYDTTEEECCNSCLISVIKSDSETLWFTWKY